MIAPARFRPTAATKKSKDLIVNRECKVFMEGPNPRTQEPILNGVAAYAAPTLTQVGEAAMPVSVVGPVGVGCTELGPFYVPPYKKGYPMLLYVALSLCNGPLNPGKAGPFVRYQL
jgi:hypothetical protein